MSYPKPIFTVGDMAWSTRSGFRRIELGGGNSFSNGGDTSLYHGDSNYQRDGREFSTDIFPSLFTLEQAARLGYVPAKRHCKKEVQYWTNVEPSTGIICILATTTSMPILLCGEYAAETYETLRS